MMEKRFLEIAELWNTCLSHYPRVRNGELYIGVLYSSFEKLIVGKSKSITTNLHEAHELVEKLEITCICQSGEKRIITIS